MKKSIFILTCVNIIFSLYSMEQMGQDNLSHLSPNNKVTGAEEKKRKQQAVIAIVYLESPCGYKLSEPYVDQKKLVNLHDDDCNNCFYH